MVSSPSRLSPPVSTVALRALGRPREGPGWCPGLGQGIAHGARAYPRRFAGPGCLVRDTMSGYPGGVSLPPLADSPGLGFQPGNHICAFYNGGGNHLDDIVVDFVSQGLQSGDTVMYVLRTHTRIFLNGLIVTNPYYIPKRQFLGGR